MAADQNAYIPASAWRSAIATAEALYHRLVLLVGPSGSGKTDLLRVVAEGSCKRTINVNLVLAERLLELTPKQRALRLPGILSEIVAAAEAPVLLDNLEMLFACDLGQDPLRLLQGVSRNQTIVATWNGTYQGKRLAYAEPGHPEYRHYEASDAQIVLVEKETLLKAAEIPI